ncbi:TonB-dependent siderophore receptor [Marinomonas mediterranea]|jgi:TonB-dependent siderophore receptor|uniref:TonB-dependent siderophore receptor n=1 Tax=Marinomonas mediterranea (strain ATCC 700492 / JCM 21426 / NBRC 103028 / MMB-1) TaxID=717774 RepID=F2K4D8_MARM1|nr:TonB-dependent siderophore receptor [Marinomonas mediterranea]ADZ90237.1 TonB-dependent siderophore receptor [Marinomonas mediterranea MMB-1]WCN16430.1 TonB-dependent siderophore receptor [Marinomonas mediterranea MMB-1]
MKKTALARYIGRETQKKALGMWMLSMFAVPMAIAADGASEDAVELDTLVVRGTELSRYEFDEAESATGFNADIDDVPRTVQVIPEQLILDQNSKDLSDVLSNSAAVTRSDGFGGTETEVNIRGFGNEYLFVDGSPVSSRYNVDVANIESVEVVLGPASVLHGQVSPGGMINVVTKKPQVESAHSVQVDLDEYGKQKLTLDSTGSLSDDVQYRIVVSGEDSETFREVKTEDGTFNTERKSLMVSPSLSYTPDDQNTFTVRLSHTEQELPIDRGTVMVNDGNDNFSVADIPRERVLGSEFDIRDSEEDLLQFDWDYELDNGWTNKFKVGYYEKEFDDYQTRAVRGFSTGSLSDYGSPAAIVSVARTALVNSVQSSNNLLARRVDFNDMESSDLFVSDSLSGDYELAGLDHTLYIGANFHSRKEDSTDSLALTTFAGMNIVDLDAIDITNSVNSSNSKLSPTAISNSDTTTNEFGFSIQNLTYVTDRLNVLAGLRYDKYDLDGENKTFYTTSNSISYTELSSPDKQKIDSSNDHVSGQLGAIYDLTDTLSTYVSYAESFKPNFPTVTEGVYSGDFDPETAKQVEVGIKSSALDDRLRVSLSAYKLERKNVATVDGNLNTILNGKTETSGVDLTSSIQFLEGLNVLASYSYMDAEIMESNDGTNDGNTPYNIPENKARIWGSYEVKGGDLAGLGFGVGAEYVDKRFGNDANAFTLPSYTVYDAAVWYYVALGNETQLRLNAGVKNLTDETYYTASGSNVYRINVGDPRTVYATARLEF